MDIIRNIPAVVVTLVTLAISVAGQTEDSLLYGCYKPLRGFATSLCTDGASCTVQTGIYKIVLWNEDAPTGQRMLVMSGLFDGLITAMPNACGGADVQHVLTDRDKLSSISTGPDVACLTGGGDFVNTVEIVETLSINEGTGAYANLLPGGTVTLTGKLGLKAGINKFKVTPLPSDGLCFGY